MPSFPLVVTLGVEPDTIEFEVAKSVAEYVKINIITKAGFDDIEIAIREFATSFSGATPSPKLPSLDPCSTGPSPSSASVRIHARHRRRAPQAEGSLSVFMTQRPPRYHGSPCRSPPPP